MKDRPHHRVLSCVLSGAREDAETSFLEANEDEFARWASRHGLSSIIFALAADGGRIRATLHDDRLLEAQADMRRGVWMAKLLDEGTRRGVTFYGFKGCGIAHMPEVYPTPDLRPLGDVDLLVERSALRDAVEAAECMGFRSPHGDPSVAAYLADVHYNVPMVHEQHGYLELHAALYRDIPTRASDAMLARSVESSLYSRPARRLDSVDLFLVLAVHLGITEGTPLWVWPVDLYRVAETFDEHSWAAVVERAVDCGAQIFVWAALELFSSLWSLRLAGAGAPVPERLFAHLSPRERRAAVDFVNSAPKGFVRGDRLSMARRLSGRPVRGRLGVLSSLFCHPGVVCLELGVRSDAPMFWWHRVRHVSRRFRRGLRAMR